MQPAHFISGYRLMWMIVMFDLPVVTREDRKEYTRFRNCLLDYGFSMGQYSVYFRLVSSKERVEKFEKKLAEALPEHGEVQIITITDKQYANIRAFQGGRAEKRKKQGQLQLF